MAQLIVKDLEFCHTEQSELKGGGWLALDVALDASVFSNPPYGLGYAQGFGFAVGVGNNFDGTKPNASVVVVTGGAKG